MFVKLRNIRKNGNISCKRMSELLGLKTRGGYHKKEIGIVPFTLPEAQTIANFFKTTIDYIFNDENTL